VQLSLFDYRPDILKIANELLDCLNNGRKAKEIFYPVLYFEKDNYTALIATDKVKYVGNIIDEKGNTPSDMSACWRNLGIIMEDLNIK
jgi:hypothetical protein